MSPNINDAFPSKYLKATDLAGAEPIVTIDRVDYEPVGRDREMKPVLYFVGKAKGIVLNKTNANKLIELTHSAITEEWRGTRIRLYASEATFGGDTYDVVRVKGAGKPAVRLPTPPPPPVTPEPPEHFSRPITDDDIPF